VNLHFGETPFDRMAHNELLVWAKRMYYRYADQLLFDDDDLGFRWRVCNKCGQMNGIPCGQRQRPCSCGEKMRPIEWSDLDIQ
jgi:hypothetical protein